MNGAAFPARSATYQRVSGLVLGFHGCDRSVGEAVLAASNQHLEPSKNDYDWLGDGVYFWENDPQRAYEFAQEVARKPHKSAGSIKEPFVVGAVIDLGLCLNFLERPALDELEVAYRLFHTTFRPSDKLKEFPKNKGQDRGARFLDAAVIAMLHRIRSRIGSEATPMPPYSSVRGAFWEGGELYPGAGFEKKSHIQIAVRAPAQCIKGYFRPMGA
jgi:hypothetical protein